MRTDVRFGSEADVLLTRMDVRFTPQRGHCIEKSAKCQKANITSPKRRLKLVSLAECRQTHRATLSFRRRSEPNDARSRPVARRRAAARVVTAGTRDS